MTKTEIIKKLEHYDDMANEDYTEAFTEATDFAEKNHLDTVDEALHAFGVGTGEDVGQWFDDYYVADENEGKAQAKKIEKELDDVDPDTLYLGNQALGFGNYGYTPEDIEEADAGDVETAIGQAIDYVKSTTDVKD